MAVLFEKRDILGKEDLKTIRVYAFDVPPDTESLEIEFHYSPEEPESTEFILPDVLAAMDEYFSGQVPDEVFAVLPQKKKQEIVDWLLEQLRNHIHFSLFDAQGEFRGWWERSREGIRPPVIVSPETADPGFIPGEIPTGTWRLELEIHGLVTDHCEFSLVVHSESKRETTVVPIPSSSPGSPKQAGPRWYRGELHLHTHHSDGRCSLREMVDSAHRKGLDFIALTDHNNTAGLREIERNSPVTVIPGIEFTTFKGHALGLNIDRYIPWTRDGTPQDPMHLSNEVRKQNGLFCLSHPNTMGDPVFPGCKWTDERLQASAIDLIEVWHGDYEREAIGTIKTLLLWDALLLEGHRTVAVAGGDKHVAFTDEDAPGMPWTMIHAQSADCEDLIDGLRRGKVYVTRGPLVDFWVEGGGRQTGIGEEAEFLRSTMYLLCLTARGLGQGAYVRIFREGGLYVEMPLSSSGNSDLTFRCMVDRDETWYRAEIYRYAKPRDQLLAFTNPIYVRRKAHGYLPA